VLRIFNAWVRGLNPLCAPDLQLSKDVQKTIKQVALRRMGYTNEEMTGHGFRSMPSTTLNEQGWHPDLI
jgi:hypothetical protein